MTHPRYEDVTPTRITASTMLIHGLSPMCTLNAAAPYAPKP